MENIVDAGSQPQESFDVVIPTLDDNSAGQPTNGSPDSNVHTNVEESDEIQIDERFKELDPNEGRIRTLKSQKDRAIADHNKLLKDYAEKEQIASLLDQMTEDEGLLMAFISEIKPDLVKSRNAADELKAQLKKEFGDDFKPSLTREEADRDDPFGRDAQYYSRIDELKIKLKAEVQPAANVKEYLKRKREKEEADARKYEMERETVRTQKKMSDVELKAVSDWALKLSFAQIVDIHRFLRKIPSKNPNLTSVPGGGEVAKSEKSKWLDEVMPIKR